MIAFVLLRVLLILLLVAANAFFAAAEFALVSVRETRIQQLIDAGRIGARILQKLHHNLDEVVNGVQLGVTIVSLTLGWVGEPLLARLIQGLFGSLPYIQNYSHGIAIAIAFMAITCLHVILGELVPKSLALQRAEQVALAVAAPMEVFLALTRPILFGMSRAAGFVLRVFGSRRVREGAVHSPDELKLIVTASRQFGQIPPFQEEMIHNALELEDLTVRQVMVPRPKIFSIPGDITLDAALERVVDEQHSRIPVFDPARGPEHIIGILYAKDLMRWTRLRLSSNPTGTLATRVANVRVSQIMHEVLVIPETKALADMLEEFKSRKRHMAIVVDEFGSTAGVITVEDILEQLVGEIEDEFDVPAPQQPVEDGDTAFILDAAMNLRDLESQYELSLPPDSGFETLAGFVLTRLQRIPKPGDTFDYKGYHYEVDAMDGLRIAKIKLKKLSPEPVEQMAH